MELTEKERIIKEQYYEERTNSISQLLSSAKRKDDLDFILKKFNIKCIKNKKPSSPMSLKMDVKRKIIKMSITEPEDVFDYDFYSQKKNLT